jgi:hypothetical protein
MSKLDHWREDKGSAIVLFALAITVLAGFAAISLDAGVLYLSKTKLNAACDAAALAASQELPVNPANTQQVAEQYVALNHFQSEDVEVTVSEDNSEVKVKGKHTLPLFFARVFGMLTSEVGAQAVARVDCIRSVTGAAPLSIGEQSFVFGEEYYLKDSPSVTSDPNHHTGWYGPLSLGGNGASNYGNNLKYGYPGVIRIGEEGEVIETETGNMSGPTSSGISYRILGCHHTPRCTFDSFSPDCPRVLIVPVVVPVLMSGNQVKTVRVLGFAAFFVENTVNSGNENYVTGRFVKMVASGQVAGGSADYGLYTTRLVQ